MDSVSQNGQSMAPTPVKAVRKTLHFKIPATAPINGLGIATEIMSMRNLSLRMKLAVGFGVPLLILVVVGAVSYASFQKAGELSADAVNKVRSQVLMVRIEDRISEQRNEVRGFLIDGSRKEEIERYAENNRLLADAFTELDGFVQTEKGKQMLAGIRAASDAYERQMDRIIELQRAGKTKEAADLVYAPQTAGLRDEVGGGLRKLEQRGEELETASRREQAAAESRMTVVLVSLVFAGLIGGSWMAVYTLRNITGRVSQMVASMQAITNNDLSWDDMTIKNKDEIGVAGKLQNQMKNHLRRMVRSIAETAERVAAASEELSNTSQQITTNSEETSAQAKVVSDSAQTVSQNLQTVATGAEEMGASIKEIAKNASESARVATSAVKVAESATSAVAKLGDSSNEIGQVIKVITSIAQQTNLLALNATIEAARAGEAGKGFAVVANEVKELAKETAEATEDISRKIEAIQTDTKAAVEAIASISEVINQVNGISNTIATAVEEQNATTNEMTRNVSEAARSSGEITSNIAGVAEAAESTSHGATDTQKAAQQLVETSTELRRLVEQFRIERSGSPHEMDAGYQGRSLAAHAGV